MESQKKLTKISEIGEFGLIEKLQKNIGINNNLTIRAPSYVNITVYSL